MDIPAIYQYYPIVPLSDLSDLYSAGENTLNNKKICIISYLPKTLRIDGRFPFNNVYVLYVENTALVDSVEWSIKLYKHGVGINAGAFLGTKGNIDSNKFVVGFPNDLFESNGEFKFDRMKVTCKVRKGAEEKKLSVEHNFAKMLNVQNAGLFSENQSVLFAGNPGVANLLFNNLKDYFHNGAINWFNDLVDIDVSGENTLTRIAASIIYHTISTSKTPLFMGEAYYDLTAFDNKQIEAFLSDANATTYDAPFTNGICNLPLHVLSEVLQGTAIPDFDNINLNNKIYSIIVHDPQVVVNTVQDEFLQVVPLKLSDLKERLINDKERFLELYNLTLFPKSAIKLCTILVKYIHACSVENNCLDCKNRSATWPVLGLDGLKNNQDFLRNILTHYYNGPANNVNFFADEAMKITNLVWSPTIHTLINLQPRIVKAYFAKKILKKIGDEFAVDFERIDSSMSVTNDNDAALATQPTYDTALGRQVYLVVETLHCRGKQLTINVMPSNGPIGGGMGPLEVQVGTSFVSDITATVGDPSALKTNNNALPGTIKTQRYLAIDNADRAIVKLTLRPAARAAFDAWTNVLSTNTAELGINVRLPDHADMYVGNNVTSKVTQASFLTAADPYDPIARFRVVNRIVFEIYHEDNAYKHRIANGGTFVGKMAKIENDFVFNITNGSPQLPSRKVSYFYHDQNDYEHYFGDFDITVTQRWPITSTQPTDLVYMTDINAFTAYNRRGVHIDMTINSPRRWVDLRRLAGLLGAMAITNTADLCFNGFSFANGSATPSVSHINGVNGDVRYLRTDFSGDPCLLTDAQFDYDRQVIFNNAVNYYGFGAAGNTRMLSENFMHNGVSTLLPHTTHFHRIMIDGVSTRSRDVNVGDDYPQYVLEGPYIDTEVSEGTVTRHNNHLHMQGFNETYVEVVNLA